MTEKVGGYELNVVAWRPKLEYPITYVTGKPSNKDIEHWGDVELAVSMESAEAAIAQRSVEEVIEVLDAKMEPVHFIMVQGQCIGYFSKEQLETARLQGAKSHDAREMRDMLHSMQSGEMTVSRGVEVLEMWLAGNYSTDQIPAAENTLPEDVMPWDEIHSLRDRLKTTQTIDEDVNDELLDCLKELAKNVEGHVKRGDLLDSFTPQRAFAAIEKAEQMKLEKKLTKR